MKLPSEVSRDESARPETDDFIIALELANDMCGRTHPANVIRCYAQWVATLREHYCEIGRQTAEINPMRID